MDTLRSAGHLQRELGDELFEALVSSDNTVAVRKFVEEELLKSILPTTMTVGGRIYDILGFLRGDEKYVKGDVMVARAKEMGAHNGKEEREHLLKHQGDIPIALRGKVAFVFTDDRHPVSPEDVYFVCWDGGRWVASWRWLGSDWGDDYRVLRRKSV